VNFFEHQHRAKKNSSRLVILFTLAVIAIIVAIYFPAQYVMAEYFWRSDMIKDHPVIWSYKLFAYVAGGTLCLILIASWLKIRELGEGGVVVAHMMNGRLVDPDTNDFKERQLLNVVDEMALASGIPSPNVYLLDSEQTINAFAAGYTTGDAVIGVTRGTIDKLTRDELQGVIGHEFSHILNGDMRLNIRLLSLLHGILVIAIIGRVLLSGTRSRSSSRRNKDGGGGLIVIGLALMAIGWIGYFFGRLIQSAVSRQREFLADASSVQFTRNADGIGSALKKIAGYKGTPASGSYLLTGQKDEIAHMTFASVNFSEMFGWTSSHPPIENRIQAIDKSFDPRREQKQPSLPDVVTQFTSTKDDGPQRSIRIDDKFIPVNQNIRYTAGAIVGLVGTIPQQALDHQRSWLQSLPEVISSACRHSIKARAVIYALIAEYNDDMFEKIKSFLKIRDPHTVATLENIWVPLKQLGIESRLQLIDLCIPSLRTLTHQEYKMFFQNLGEMMDFDQKIGIFDFILVKIIKKHLKNHKNPKRRQGGSLNDISQITPQLTTLLSLVAQTSTDGLQAERLFHTAMEPFTQGASMIPLDQISISNLNESVKKLAATTFEVRQKIIEASARAALSDQKITWKEREILRAVGDALDSPIPHLE
jgi:Zn-dependent protease with chaperone function